MGLLYNRFVEVRFPEIGVTIGGRATLDGREIVYPPTIRFQAVHTAEPAPNEAEVILTNLSADTQRLIMVEGAKVEVEAGFWPQGGGRETGLIYRGQIRTARTNTAETGIEAQTKLVLGDGDDAYTQARVRRVFDGDRSHVAIADAIVQVMAGYGVSRGRVEIPEWVEPRPRTVDRLAWRELDDLAYQHDLTWYIQDGVLNIHPRDEVLESTGLILTPDTGVLATPQFSDKGVVFRTLLVPELRPGYTFTLRNERVRTRVNEVCKIERVAFIGANNGGFFGAEVTALYAPQDTEVERSRQRYVGMET